MSKSKEIKAGKIISEVFFGLGMLVLSLLSLTVFWVIDTWKSISFGEIVLQLSSPIEGTSSDIINMFYLRCLLPAVLIAITLTVVGIILKIRKFRVMLLHLMSIYLALVTLVVSIIFFDRQFGALDYYQNINTESEFIELNYVDPATVDIVFPKQKRNLIYIYLESMEISYSDKDNGGYLNDNCIPELTELAYEGECFAAPQGGLNGARPLFGTQYTMGGMLAQNAGLPMFGNLGNSAEFQDDFYPGATTLGDILADNGYVQELMVGSDAEFGGRAKFFEQHGGYEIFDLSTARDRGYIPEDYYVWWGFEDAKLFEYAKAEVTALAASGEPFNFTMLTADTHFPNGLVCDKCGSEYSSQYENVIACSSKQVYDFIEWIKEQDFYDNTTIIISGDHLTMDSDFSNSVSDDYERKTYVAIINSAVDRDTEEERIYSTLDLFPTTLTALGCELGSNRLALGTDLYSEMPTLIEENDITYVNRELAKDSPFVETNIATWDKYNLKALDYNCELNVETRQISGDKAGYLVMITGLELFGDTDKKIYATLTGSDGSELARNRMIRRYDLWFGTVFDADLFEIDVPVLLKIEVEDADGQYHTVVSRDIAWESDLSTMHRDIDMYLNWISGLEDVSVLMAVQDEAAWQMSDSTIEILRSNMGLEADLYMRCSYCAVIDNGNVIYEQTSPDSAVSMSGVLSSGTGYNLMSASFDYGCACSIEIDGVQYAPNTRGLNIVVYDNRTGEVIDACVFDTFASDCLIDHTDFAEYGDVDFEYDEDAVTLDVSVTIDSKPNYSNSILFIWDKDSLSSPLKIDLSDKVTDEGRVCSTSVDISGFDPDTLYCSIYIKNDAVVGRYRTKVFE